MTSLPSPHLSHESDMHISAAYWAAMPPALRLVFAHMMIWLRSLGPSVFSRRDMVQTYQHCRRMNVDALTAAARRQNGYILLRAAMPVEPLRARTFSMVTALHGFKKWQDAPMPKLGYAKAARSYHTKQALRVMRHQRLRWARMGVLWFNGFARGAITVNRRVCARAYDALIPP